MTQKNTLENLSLLLSTLDYIDKKIPLLTHAEKDLIDQQKQLDKLTHKFSLKNTLVYWLVFTVIAVVPMSILNSIIDTSFNFFFLTPIVSAIAVLLYRNKFNNTTAKKQAKGLSQNIKQSEEKFYDIAGEINYSKSLAEELISRLLLSKEDFDLLSCDNIYINFEALNYVYGYLETHKTASFKDAIESFKTILNTIKQDPDKASLYNDYEKANNLIRYREGALKRCIKIQSPPN